MESKESTLPAWLLGWRWLMRIMTALVLLTFFLTLPLIVTNFQLRPETTREQVLELVANNTVRLASILAFVIAVGLILVVVGAVVGLIANLIVKVTRRSRQLVTGRPFTRPPLIFLTLALAFAVIILGTASIVISTISLTLFTTAQCLPVVRVMTFVDRNGNGIRDMNETGLPGVKGAATVSYFNQTGYSDETLPFETADNGLGLVYEPKATVGDGPEIYTPRFCSPQEIALKVDTPSGYTATTRTTCGAFEAAYFPSGDVVICYVGFIQQS